MINPIALPVVEPSQTGEARRKATALVSQLGFDEVERGKVGIVTTEIANNLSRHATEGMLLLRPLEQDRIAGIEILALDKGPGMSNISECLRDGFSTAGTPGNGLGAAQRLSNLFELYSVPEQGTALLCQLWAAPLPEKSPSRLEIGAATLAKTGEEVSGDGWAYEDLGDRHLVLVSDGLGHGTMAAQASLEAIGTFKDRVRRSPPEIMEALHTSLRSTRGAAVAIAEIDLVKQIVCYTGIGNISGTICSYQKSTSLVSHNGTVGHEVRKIQPFIYNWMENGLLIMHSDGLGTQWRLDRYPGLLSKHPSLIAGVLYRDFNRGRDDVTVVVVRERQT